MDTFINKFNHYKAGQMHNLKKYPHRNSGSILSILFDETNCSEEKFNKLKTELNGKHMYHELLPKYPGADIFSRLS